MIDIGTSKPFALHKGSWFQFSMRTLIVLMVVACAVLSWLGLQVKRAFEHGEAVRAIREAGGSIEYNIEPSRVEWQSKWLGRVLGDEAVSKGDAVLRGGTEFGDDDMRYLPRLINLKSLFLSDSHVTDAGLFHLRGMTQLRSLYIDGTRVTDVGLCHLHGMAQLIELDIGNTQVTDAGLIQLHGMTQLRWIVLRGPKVTESGAEKLRNALPNAWVFLD